MGMLDRYRKSGGFLNLLILLETSAQSKQEKFLTLIAEENQAWADEIKKKMLSFDKILNWDPSILMEFAPNLPERIIASAVWGLPQEKKEVVLKALAIPLRRKVEEQFTGNPPPSNEIVSCQLRFVTEARQCAQRGAIRFDKFAIDLVIPEDIEDKLNKSSRSQDSSSKWDPETTTTSFKFNPENTISGANVTNLDEVRELKKKIMNMGKELENLEKENVLLRHKIEQIKKLV